MLNKSMFSYRWPSITMLSPSSADCITELSELVSKSMAFYLSNARTFVAIIFTIIFIAYYLRQVVRKPVFFCSDGKFRWFLLANCSKIQEKYWPPIWAIQAHVQTALASYLRARLPDLNYRRDDIWTPDGGLISLDWYEPISLQSLKSTAGSLSSSTDESKPIALLLPGLTGDSQSEYVKSLVPVAHQVGYRAVVFNNRGRGNMKLLTPRFYCAANCEDLELALEHLRRHSTDDTQIVATGISLGGIVLARYLIESSDRALVDAALLISVPWDFIAGADSLEKWGLNSKLNQLLTKSLSRIIYENKEVLENCQKINFEEVLKSQTIREFDGNFTIKMFGFKSVDDYYTQSSPKGKLCCIKRPTLCVNAADDMIAPVSELPIHEVEESSHVAMIVTSRGGHIGFMEGFLPILPFFTEKLLHQYLGSLFQLKHIRRDLI